MNIKIRQERQNDFYQIYDLVKTAFQTAKVADGTEQGLVNRLRNGLNYIPELALVAEMDHKLVGHIMLTKNSINGSNFKRETLLLAPICVLLEHRNIGIGSQLINTSFEIARKMGYESVVLVGDPAYYNRFGFRKLIDFRIKELNGIPEEYVLACELVPDALHEINGTIDMLSCVK